MIQRFCTILLVTLTLTFSAAGEPVTPQRLAGLNESERAAWDAYLERSNRAAQTDENALRAELQSNGMSIALKAPDGGDFKLPAKPGEPYYASPEASRLADIIISYQTPSGGWSKHTGYNKGPRKPGMQWTSQNEPGERRHYVATFDNRSTTEQLLFLAYVWHATQRDDCRLAFIKGLNFILDAQYPNGGWPQGYPLEGGYHDDITFNDDAMTRVLRVLSMVAGNEPYFAFVDESPRARASDALRRGIDCVLKLQIEQNGTKAVWCAQYDALNLAPSQARAMEPPTLSGAESARVLEFLMSLRNPSPQVVSAIENAIAWFEQAKITDISRVQRDGKTFYEPNPASTEIYWARFYDLRTAKPVFPGRDGVLYETFAELAAKNSVGYDYYTTLPSGVLNSGQKKWRKMLAE